MQNNRNIANFNDTEYAVPITVADTIQELHSLTQRVIGTEKAPLFVFSICEKGDSDYFSISSKDGKIEIVGSNGTSCACGLNYYLKYNCNVHIAQADQQTKMPKVLPILETPIHQTLLSKVRYAYNYCTHAYQMAFWGKEEWQRELDWLALNGVNAVLDLTGIEEVWRRFLAQIGYTAEEIRDFLPGPLHLPWFYMQNLTHLGGPLPEHWFSRRVDLARWLHRKMNILGMQAAMQGYCGMVPQNLAEKDPSAEIIVQGLWCAVHRPDMLQPDSEGFAKYAALFYKIQEDVFGKPGHFYSTDPFHEGGNTGGISLPDAGAIVLDAMLAHDKDGIWMVQGWGENPQKELLRGILPRREHVLVIELSSEYNDRGRSGDYLDVPWIWCVLGNFGGKNGIYGPLTEIGEVICSLRNQGNSHSLVGIGITPEGTDDSAAPLYDLLFEMAYRKEKVDINDWLHAFITRRYGAFSKNVDQCYRLLTQTIYAANQAVPSAGAPENVAYARPALVLDRSSTWGNAKRFYDTDPVLEAAEYMLADYDLFGANECYHFDLACVLRQILSDKALFLHQKLNGYFEAGEDAAFSAVCEKLIKILSLVGEISAVIPQNRIETWLQRARQWGETDEEKALFEKSARMLITTWGERVFADDGGLDGYAHRQWSGVTEELYIPRLAAWRDACVAAMKNKTAPPSIDYFAMDYKWVISQNPPVEKPLTADLKKLAQETIAFVKS